MGTCNSCHGAACDPFPNSITFLGTGALSTITKVMGQPIVLVGAKGQAICGHATTAATGSTSVFVEGQSVHRTGDKGTFPIGVYTASLGLQRSVLIGV